MAKPLPRNPRLSEEDRGIYFEVELEGRNWKAFITFEAVDSLYAGADRVRAVSDSSYIAGKVAERIRVGDDVEPIHLSSTMFTS